MENYLSISRQAKAGSLSAAVVTFLVYPFDLVIMRLQVMPPSTFSGPIDCLKKMLRREGILSLFKGLSSPLLNSGVVSAAPFGAYAVTRNACTTLFGKFGLAHNQYRYFTPYIAGGAAGLTSACLSVPSDLMKTQLGISMENGRKRTLFMLIKEVYTKKGLTGFFTGLKATIIRDVPGGTLYYGIYHTLSQAYADFTQRELKNPAEQILTGALVGILTTPICHPLDVVKSRIQSKKFVRSLATTKKTGGWIQTFVQVYKEGKGPKLLYRGFGTSLVRCTVSSAIMFFCLEKFLSWL